MTYDSIRQLARRGLGTSCSKVANLVDFFTTCYLRKGAKDRTRKQAGSRRLYSIEGRTHTKLSSLRETPKTFREHGEESIHSAEGISIG